MRPLCAIVGFVFCMLHYAWTEERHVSVAPSESNDSVKLTDILNVFRVNRPFLALCIHGICICTMQYVSSTLGTYMYGDVLGNIGMMSMASAVSMPLGILALIITPKIADKVGLERMIRICLLTASAIYFCAVRRIDGCFRPGNRLHAYQLHRIGSCQRVHLHAVGSGR